MKLSEKQLEVMASDENLLVTGGPGSGKTTISILKAAEIVEHHLLPQQKVLFLSFARPTVARIIEAIDYEHNMPLEHKARIKVDTYHAFFWRILKAHGYLIGLPRRLDLLAPPAEAIILSVIRSGFQAENKLDETQKAEKNGMEDDERRRLALQEGRICFNLFAPLVSDLMHGSDRICKLIATMYPVIILDEFQDTDAEQWRAVQALGKHSRLIALADPEQRIYDFIGADPKRLNHFREAFKPTELDFSDTNHRSTGTDIAKFGNDILTGNFQQKSYVGISIEIFEPFPAPALSLLITQTYAARKRLKGKGNPNWSLAILVPTKKMTRLVSDTFREPPAGMQAIAHKALIEMEAAILGSEIIAHLMQPNGAVHVDVFVELMCNYYQGKGGERPTKGALQEADRLNRAYIKWCEAISAGKNPSKSSVLNACFAVYDASRSVEMTGNPDKDWRAIREILEDGCCRRLKEIGNEVRNIRLLERGAQVRLNLTQDWRDNGCYTNARAIVQQAFVQEHFATGARPESGVVIMNMHKAKGKQFDEVILFEGWPIRDRKKEITANMDRFIRNNKLDEINDSSRQNFRVSVTRSRHNTTILTPRGDPCALFTSA